MADNTENLDLVLPELEDFVDVEALNANFAKIDAGIAAQSDEVLEAARQDATARANAAEDAAIAAAAIDASAKANAAGAAAVEFAVAEVETERTRATAAEQGLAADISGVEVSAAADATTKADAVEAALTLVTDALRTDLEAESDRAQGVEADQLAEILARYIKPGSGIPATDLAAGVRSLLDLAASAVQLDGSGKLASNLLPAIATNETITVANQAARLALTSSQVQPGDLVIQSDTGQKFWLGAANPTLLTSWVEVQHPESVTSVMGQVGAVTGLALASELSAAVTAAAADATTKANAARAGAVSDAQVAGDARYARPSQPTDFTSGLTDKGKPLVKQGSFWVSLGDAEWGAVADARYQLAPGAINSGSQTFSSSVASFTVSDIGKAIVIGRAGAATLPTRPNKDLVTTITSVISSTTCTVADPAAASVVNAYWGYGTDNTNALRNAIAATSSKKGTLHIPQGNWGFYAIFTPGSGGSDPSPVSAPNVTITGTANSRLISSQNIYEKSTALYLTGDNVFIHGFEIDFYTPMSIDEHTFVRDSSGHTIRIGDKHFDPHGYYSKCRVTEMTINNSRNTPVQIGAYAKATVSGNNFEVMLGNGMFVGNIRNGLKIQNNTIRYMGDDGIFVYTGDNNTELNKSVTITGNTCEFTYAKCLGISGVRNGVVSNNTFRYSWASAIRANHETLFGFHNNENLNITSNTIDFPGQFYGPGQYKDVKHSSCDGIEYGAGYDESIAIRSNTITNSARYGIYAFGGSECTIENNRISNSASSGIGIGTPDGPALDRATVLKITDNTIVNPGASGITCGQAKSFKIEDNIIVGWVERPIWYGYMNNGVIANNTLIDTNNTNVPVSMRPGSVNSNVSVYNNPLINPTTGITQGAPPQNDVKVYTGNATWTKPVGATTVDVVCIGAGGGGGSGRRGAAGTVRGGGGGGGGGGVSRRKYLASALTDTVSVVVGSGGSGGAGVTANDTNGNAGTASAQQTTFGAYQFGARGAGGAGGGNAGASGGNPGNLATSSAGAGSSGTGGAGNIAVTAVLEAAGGGSGGGITSADVSSAGGAGATPVTISNVNAVAGADNGGAGAAGTSTPAWAGGGGGAGGGSSITAAGGAGGVGGNYGGGGGGGGASVNGFASGAGGNGGPGLVVVVSS